MFNQNRYFQNAIAVVFGLTLVSSCPVHAAFVDASSDITIGNLRFTLSDPNAQIAWTDVWYGEVRAHAADTDSLPADDYDSLLGNDGSIKAEANTAHVSSLANYEVVNGSQIGMDPAAGVTGSTLSALLLQHPNMQADGSAISNFDNYFRLFDTANPNSTEAIDVLIQMDFAGSIFGSADAEGFFVDITHIASLSVFDSLSGGLLGSDLFRDSISGTNTTLIHNNSGVLEIPVTLNYNTEYWLYAEADSEIQGYTTTVPEPNTLLLLFICVPAMFRLSRKQFAT
ncbi:PEP-CTERM sorting domain-containing protein [Methylomonas sp. MgM2]